MLIPPNDLDRHPRDSLGATTAGGPGTSITRAASDKDSGLDPSNENNSAMIGSPYTLVGQGKKDPFATYPGHNLPVPMLDALEHCKSVDHPRLCYQNRSL